jgi:hypothetical protein
LAAGQSLIFLRRKSWCRFARLVDGSAITIVGVGAADLTDANFVFGEVPELTNDATIEIGDGAMLPLSGLVHNTGTIEMNSDSAWTLLQLIRDGIDLDGGGQILMSDSDGNVIMGTTPDIVLTNVDNTISGACHIGYGQMTLVNHGLIVATGTHSLEIDTGLNAVVNTGTLQSTGSGGLNVHSDVVNDGLIWAYGGDITVLGAVSGSGSAMISGSATVTFGAAAAIDVEFAADAAGTLELGDSFKGLYESGRKPGPIVEAACWAHARRKFHDVHAANGSEIARQALERIGELYRIEQQIRGQPPDERRRRRQARSLPIAEGLRGWAHATLAKLSGRSELAKAFRYMLARWPALIRCFADGRLEIDNNPAERALRGIAVGRKNYLFAGSDRGGERAAAIYSLIETAKLNGLDPQAWLRDVLDRIADHPNSRIGELLPWNWSPATPAAEAA